MKDESLNYIPFDRDFVLTTEHFFFCIVGYVHPPDRAISYLKYIPADSGKWKLENQNLQRVLPYYSAQAVLNTFQFLKKDYPHYLFQDQYNNIEFSAVPFSYIKQYYSSKNKLKEIFALTKLDTLQDKLKSFVLILSKLSGVSIDAFGITWSILLNIHNPSFSDLDVTIHGYDNSVKVKRTMLDIFRKASQEIIPLNAEEAEIWQKDKVKRFNISIEAAKMLFQRKWNMGKFRKTRFSLHPIREPHEINEKYGDKIFTKMGQIEIDAKVVDNSEALFLPSKYKITDADIQNGRKVGDIKEIISYEGLFDAVAEKDEIIKAKGELEFVRDNLTCSNYHRIVIGSKKQNVKEFLTMHE